MLKDTNLAPDFPFDDLVEISGTLSGSDLKELCRNAAMVPVREFMRKNVDMMKLDKSTLAVSIRLFPNNILLKLTHI
jgi:SpoVK/Ycf46/Vps4 family AAA+-type ATPase